jgi:Asp-tRNA(Asn)/Glu-tRNA(Gln) amidotransferase B subunit
MPIIKENDKLVEQYKSGNDKALNALVGKVMKIDKSYSAVVIKEVVEGNKTATKQDKKEKA